MCLNVFHFEFIFRNQRGTHRVAERRTRLEPGQAILRLSGCEERGRRVRSDGTGTRTHRTVVQRDHYHQGNFQKK